MEVENIIERGAIGKCAEMVGGAEKVLEMTIEYAREREQFGCPIGSFQAVQHHCADKVIDLEGSKYITYQAASLMTEGISCRSEIAMAKAWVSEAYR